MQLKTFFTLVSIGAVVIGVGDGAGAQNANQIRETLRKGDAVVSQGTLVYKRDDGGRAHRISLTYDATQRFVSRQLPFLTGKAVGSGPQLDVTQTFDGQDNYTLFRHNNVPKDQPYIEIKAGKPDEAMESYRLSGGLYPGASAVLGRGLSTLKGARTSRQGADVLIEGKASNGLAIKALLDARHGFVAKRIEQIANNRVLLRIVLGAAIPSKNGTYVASSATCQAMGVHKKFVVVDKYKLLSANFASPNARLFQVSIPKGMLVLDGRAGRNITWKMAVTKSGKALLGRTQGKIAELAQMDAQQQAEQRRQGLFKGSLLALPALLLAAFAFRKRRGASPGARDVLQ